MNNDGIKLELLYFALPMIYSPKIRKSLCSANKRSTFASKLSGEIERELIKVQSGYTNYMPETKKGLIYLGSTEELKWGDHITIGKPINFNKESGELKKFCKAAFYLGLIFSKEDYKVIFHKLGAVRL